MYTDYVGVIGSVSCGENANLGLRTPGSPVNMD